MNNAQTQNPHPEPESVVIFGVPFHDVTMEETLAHIDRLVAARKPAYFVTANLDFAAQARNDVELRRIFVEAELVLCDGTPLVWASRLLGHPLRERVAGSDMAPLLAAHAEKRRMRIFLLGGEEETLRVAAARLKADFPHLGAVDFYSPPFAPLHEIDNEEILRRLKESRPDILLVAFGCPKQEKWIYMHYREMGIPVSIGVGATIDFLAGKFRRAPRWMAVLGLEWVWRLMQEPRRLIGRYARDIAFLFKQIWQELRGIGREAALDASSSAPFEAGDNLEVVEWKGALTALRKEFFHPPTGRRPFILDLSAVTSVDHVGLGVLLRAMRPTWTDGVPGCIGRPSPAVRRAFAATGLGDVLPCAETIEEARRLMSQASGPASSRVLGNEVVFELPVRLTAGNTQECHSSLLQQWDAHPRARVLTLDCKGTVFMDSSGLGFFLKAKRLAEAREGGVLKVMNPTENVRNVLRVSRLEKLFLGE